MQRVTREFLQQATSTTSNEWFTTSNEERVNFKVKPLRSVLNFSGTTTIFTGSLSTVPSTASKQNKIKLLQYSRRILVLLKEKGMQKFLRHLGTIWAPLSENVSVLFFQTPFWSSYGILKKVFLEVINLTLNFLPNSSLQN